jgi:hypothetical protein
MSSRHLYDASDPGDELTSSPTARINQPVDPRELERRIEDLDTALQNARTIGIAIGILMANHKLTQEPAFAKLAAASQTGNVKLHLVAARVAEVGALLEPDHVWPPRTHKQLKSAAD